MKLNKLGFIIFTSGLVYIPLITTACGANNGILWLTNMSSSIDLNNMWCVVPSIDNCWETNADEWTMILHGNYNLIEFNNDHNDDIDRNNITIEISSEVAPDGSSIIQDVGIYFATQYSLGYFVGIYYNLAEGWQQTKNEEGVGGFVQHTYTDAPEISYYCVQLDGSEDINLIVTGGILIGHAFPNNFCKWINQVYFCEEIPTTPPIR